jgi:hypothetical protein
VRPSSHSWRSSGCRRSRRSERRGSFGAASTMAVIQMLRVTYRPRSGCRGGAILRSTVRVVAGVLMISAGLSDAAFGDRPILQTQTPSSAPITVLATNYDESLIAAASSDSTGTVWDVASGAADDLIDRQGHSPLVTGLALCDKSGRHTWSRHPSTDLCNCGT